MTGTDTVAIKTFNPLLFLFFITSLLSPNHRIFNHKIQYFFSGSENIRDWDSFFFFVVWSLLFSSDINVVKDLRSLLFSFSSCKFESASCLYEVYSYIEILIEV